MTSREMIGSASSRTTIDTLAWLIQDAFAGDPEHSLLANLRNIADEEWCLAARLPRDPADEGAGDHHARGAGR